MSRTRSGGVCRWRLVLVFVAGVSATRPAAGRAQTGTVAGVVRDSTGSGVIGAQVLVVGTNSRAVTGADGAYLMRGVPLGPANVSIRRLGFRTGTVAIVVTDTATAHGDLVLADIAHTLSIVAVRGAASREPYDERLSGYNVRRQRSGGHFITREQIEANPNFHLVDALRRMPGVRVVALRGSAGRSIVLGGANCPPTVFVDGFAASAGSVDLDMFDLASAEGVEVYSGSSSIPAELLPPQGQERCGVIAIWGRPARPGQHSREAAEMQNVAELVNAGAVLTADQVDVAASYQEGSASPVYPPDLLKAKVMGRVVLQFIVDAGGRVEAGSVALISATNTAFADAAREAVGRARFTPASVGNRVVRQLVQAPFEFNPEG